MLNEDEKPTKQELPKFIAPKPISQLLPPVYHPDLLKKYADIVFNVPEKPIKREDDASSIISGVLNTPLQKFHTIESENGIKVVSQQWRLSPKNVVSKRPKNMPYLQVISKI